MDRIVFATDYAFTTTTARPSAHEAVVRARTDHHGALDCVSACAKALKDYREGPSDRVSHTGGGVRECSEQQDHVGGVDVATDIA